MELYHPERYPVLVGARTTEALCTCWTDPYALTRIHPTLLSRFAIIGTLYGRAGISAIVRNLCLNPHIRTVYVFTDNPLSRTEFGKAGWESLVALWKNGVEEGGKIIGTSGQIHAEISMEAVNLVRKHVSLVVCDTLAALMSSEPAVFEAYMEPRSFADPKPDENAPLPSEHAGWSVHARTPIQAWMRVVDRIMRYGKTKGTDYGIEQRELLTITWSIAEPAAEESIDWPDSLAELVGYTGRESYREVLLNPERVGDSYTYGERLRKFDGKIDQLDHIIAELQQSTVSRRAFAVLSNPIVDSGSRNPPCLVFLQAIREGDAVHLSAVFRSHDIMKAALPNALALARLLTYIAEKISVRCGTLTITSISAHIYEHEWKAARDMLTCALWANPESKVVIETMTDPRGVVRIMTKEKQITAELQDSQGTPLWGKTGDSAREIIKAMTALDLLSAPYHYADIAIELTKAEAAAKSGIPYAQDRPLRLGDITVW